MKGVYLNIAVLKKKEGYILEGQPTAAAKPGHRSCPMPGTGPQGTLRTADPSEQLCSEGSFLPAVHDHCLGLGAALSPPEGLCCLERLWAQVEAAIPIPCPLASPALLYPVDFSPASRDSVRPHGAPDMHGHQPPPSHQAWTKHLCLREFMLQPVLPRVLSGLTECGAPVGLPLAS